MGDEVYSESDLVMRMVRDVVTTDVEKIIVGDKVIYDRLKKLPKTREKVIKNKLEYFKGKKDLFTTYGLDEDVESLLHNRVNLSSGAYLIIDKTEALTVIDVNTGSFVGTNSHEETVFAVNLQAAKEIARQVRLRNVGGIVVVDFIDMVQEEHRQQVTQELKKYLELDKAKCNVLPMSELCITQFTRKRVGDDVQTILQKPCPHCVGKGFVHDDIFVITRLRGEILNCFANGYQSAIVDLNENIMKKILQERLFSIEARGRWKDKRIYFVPHKTFKEDYFTVYGDNAQVLNLPNNAQILY